MSAQSPAIDKKQVYSWAFYDWANSAFATTVIAGFFPVFFKQYWSAGTDVNTSTFQLGVANSLSSAVIMLLAPVLGAIADCGGAKKRFLFAFTSLGVLTTGALFLVEAGAWQLAILLYVLGNIGFAGGNVFYDALIVSVAPEDKLDRVSALGFALGYLGGGLLFAVNVATTLWPESFGLADQAQAVRVAFLSVGVWWAVFSIPLLLFVREPRTGPPLRPGAAVRSGFGQLQATFRQVRRLRVVMLFLAAYWLYIDGVDTIVRMAVDYGLSLGFPGDSLIVALLITQFVGFPAALAFGRMGERIGTKRAIGIAIGVYIAVTLWAMQMTAVWEFYVLAVVIGLVQGGIQSLSRSFYARIIPPSQAGEFFGFYNMLGKFAAVIGPVLVGVTSVATGSSRLSLLAIAAMFVVGVVLLYFVNEEQGRRMARELDAETGSAGRANEETA